MKLIFFFDKLQATIAKIPKKDIKIIQDWDAKVGHDAHMIWIGTVGKFGAATTNERGLMFIRTSRAEQFGCHKHRIQAKDVEANCKDISRR